MFPSALIPSSRQSAVSRRIFSPRRALRGWLLVAASAVCLLARVQAQTAHFGTTVTLGSGFATPTGVSVDANGNVYVADNGHSAVKEIVAVNGKIPASPVINTLGSGFSNPFTVAVDNKTGNVFVTDYGNHAVKEILAAGGYTTVRTLKAGTSFIFGSAVDSKGDVFYSEYGLNLVKELVAVNGTIPDTPKVLTVGGGFNIPAGVAVDANGNVFIGDQNNNVVKEVTAASGYNTVTVVASGFSTPDGVAVDKFGNVYVANDGGNAVNEVLAVNGVIPPSPTIITLGSGFLQPFDVAVDNSGNVYVADRGNNAVKEIPVASGFNQVNVGTTTLSAITLSFTFDTAGTLGSTSVLTLGNAGMDFYDSGGGTCIANTAYTAGQVCTINVKFAPLVPGPRYGAAELLTTGGAVFALGRLTGIGVGPQVTFADTSSGISIPATTAILGSGFNAPGGVAVDVAGNVFVGDSSNNAVKEILASSGWVTVNTLSSGFSYPNGVALDGAGNLYVADTFNDALKEIFAAGGYTTNAKLAAGLSNPYGVAVDGFGNVFVADFGNNAVKEILAVNGSIPAPPVIRTLASGLNAPDGVAVDGNGNVFVANYGDGTVDEIVAVNGSIPPSPTIKTIASGFDGPSNLSLDGVGNLFVTDSGNNNVVEIMAAGGYNPVSCGGRPCPTNLPPAPNQTIGSGFNSPSAVAVSGSGFVVVADTSNNTVDLLTFENPATLNFPPTSMSSSSSQTETVTNDGNAPLIFPLPGSGTNPSISANFGWDAASTCKQTNPGSSQAFQIPGGTSCTMVIDFKPTTTGGLSGTAVLTDNNLNLSGIQQTIQLGGTGTTAPAVPATLTAPATSKVLGGSKAAFSWTAAAGAVKYSLYVGSAPGKHDIDYVLTDATSAMISNLPANGSRVYVVLYSYIGGKWQSAPFYTYVSGP